MSVERMLARTLGFKSWRRTSGKPVPFLPAPSLENHPRKSPALRWLVIAILVAYVPSHISDLWKTPLTETVSDGTMLWGAMTKEAIVGGEIHRFFTHTLLHGGLLHLLFNLAALYALAKAVRLHFKRNNAWLGIFLVGAVSGALLQLGITPEAVMVGASGGIMAVWGADISASFRLRWLKNDELNRATNPQSTLPMLFWLGVQLSLDHVIPNVGWGAHLGGLAAGLILGAVLPLRGIKRITGSRGEVVVIHGGIVGFKVVKRRGWFSSTSESDAFVSAGTPVIKALLGLFVASRPESKPSGEAKGTDATAGKPADDAADKPADQTGGKSGEADKPAENEPKLEETWLKHFFLTRSDTFDDESDFVALEEDSYDWRMRRHKSVKELAGTLPERGSKEWKSRVVIASRQHNFGPKKEEAAAGEKEKATGGVATSGKGS